MVCWVDCNSQARAANTFAHDRVSDKVTGLVQTVELRSPICSCPVQTNPCKASHTCRRKHASLVGAVAACMGNKSFHGDLSTLNVTLTFCPSGLRRCGTQPPSSTPTWLLRWDCSPDHCLFSVKLLCFNVLFHPAPPLPAAVTNTLLLCCSSCQFTTPPRRRRMTPTCMQTMFRSSWPSKKPSVQLFDDLCNRVRDNWCYFIACLIS